MTLVTNGNAAWGNRSNGIRRAVPRNTPRAGAFVALSIATATSISVLAIVVQTQTRPNAKVTLDTNAPSSSLHVSTIAALFPLRGKPYGTPNNAQDPISEYAAHRGIPAAQVHYMVSGGDTLSSVFLRNRIRDEDAKAVLAALKTQRPTSDIVLRPKQELSLELGGAMSTRDARPLLSLSLRVDLQHRMTVSRDEHGAFRAIVDELPMTRQVVLAHGVITESLAADASAAGISYPLIGKFAEIFAYDVDFQRDIRPNDMFEIYYTRYVTKDGEIDPARGDILYSRLSYNGRVKSYYRFAASDGQVDYYDATGKSARTFLMKTPVDGARITSRFGLRKHPIYGFTRQHKGIDFAAPSGTHIYASGSGTIEFAGRKGDFGNYVRIRHDSGYETAYGHMMAFAKGVRSGLHIAQGQVIGYVGMTGGATGPHLHYEVLQAGTQINPLGVKVPTGHKLAGTELAEFRAGVESTDHAVRTNPATQYAASQPQETRSR